MLAANVLQMLQVTQMACQVHPAATAMRASANKCQHLLAHPHLGRARLGDALLPLLLLHGRLAVQYLIHRLLRRPPLHRQLLRYVPQRSY